MNLAERILVMSPAELHTWVQGWEDGAHATLEQIASIFEPKELRQGKIAGYTKVDIPAGGTVCSRAYAERFARRIRDGVGSDSPENG